MDDQQNDWVKAVDGQTNEICLVCLRLNCKTQNLHSLLLTAFWVAWATICGPLLGLIFNILTSVSLLYTMDFPNPYN